jgi:hypothetical protein
MKRVAFFFTVMSMLFGVAVLVQSIVVSRYSSQAGEQGFDELMGALGPPGTLEKRNRFGDTYAGTGSTAYVDLQDGMVKRTNQASVFRSIGEVLMPSLFPSDPLASTETILKAPNGKLRMRKRSTAAPYLTMDIMDVIENKHCSLDGEQARQFLCERGIIDNKMAKRATTEDNHCLRELNREDCTLYKSCVSKIIRDNVSMPIGITDLFPTVVGDGRKADLPLNYCPI